MAVVQVCSVHGFNVHLNYNDCRGGKTPAVLNTAILLLFNLLEGGRGGERERGRGREREREREGKGNPNCLDILTKLQVMNND